MKHKVNAEQELAERPVIHGASALKIDWLTFTWKPENEEDLPYSYFLFRHAFPEFDTVPNWVRMEKSWSHYTAGFRLNENIIIHYDDYGSVQNKGVAVQIPAHALLYVFGLFNCKTPQEFMQMLYERHAQVSRLDIALDDFDRVFSPADFYEYHLMGMMKHHFHEGSISILGSTFYLGKRTSHKYLRIYDKYIESNGLINSIRYEFELKGIQAGKYAEYIRQGVDFSFTDICNEFFQLIYRDDSNISRCSVRDEWKAFCEKLSVSRKVELPDVKFSKKQANYFKWLHEKVLKKLSCLLEVDPDLLFRILREAHDLMKDSDRIYYINNLLIEKQLYGYVVDPFVEQAS